MNTSYDEELCRFPRHIIDNKQVLVVFSVLITVVATLTFLSNGTVLLAMLHTLRKQSDLPRINNHHHNSHITKLLILSMTFAGVFVGAFVMPLGLVELIHNGTWTLGTSMYKIRVLVDYLLCNITSLHTTFMAVDTYLVVCRPLVYRLLTPRVGYIMIAVAWILPTLIILLWWLLHPNSLNPCIYFSDFCSKSDNLRLLNIICGSLFFILFITVWLLYLFVLRQVWRFRKRAACIGNSKVKRPAVDGIFSIDIQESNCGELGTLDKDSIVKKQTFAALKSFRFIGTVLLFFTIFWLPDFIKILFLFNCANALPLWVSNIFDYATYLSCTVNPMIYCFNKSIKLAVKNLICTTHFKRR
ncbi:octopamine receptor beta-3R [Biomphalaria pfeifferi]|uniref:Octopamine receptor beta-3R n=1 Tax=Biomphalaria pfeifferi TaxID=112525 RepID=A0AAD8AU99_BIOPF|nr:octopamine receptor beta-3R [Biomphalaria pfeifferi]